MGPDDNVKALHYPISTQAERDSAGERETVKERERDQAKENKRKGREMVAAEGMATMVGVTATVMLLVVWPVV